jgi:hypothetical protein
VKKLGSDALFATPRSVSRGFVCDSAFEPGQAPARSGSDAEVRVGDVLITLRGPVNAAAPVTQVFSKPLFAALELAVLRPSSRLDPTYLAWFINRPESQTVLAAGRTGGAVARLPLPTLQALPLVVPPIEVQRQIAAIADLALEESRLAARLATLKATALQAQLTDIVHQHSTEGARPCTL